MNALETINNYLDNLKTAIDNFSREEIIAFAEAMEKTRLEGKKIIIFGNGGSGATASHFACDINKGVSMTQTQKYKVIALTDNMATILAYANDLSFNEVFVGQLKNFLEPGDIVVGISGSGNSSNVINAIEYANQKGNTTVGITGFGGGKLRQMTTLSVNANYGDMQVSEDIHMILVHVLMKVLTGNE